MKYSSQQEESIIFISGRLLFLWPLYFFEYIFEARARLDRDKFDPVSIGYNFKFRTAFQAGLFPRFPGNDNLIFARNSAIFIPIHPSFHIMSIAPVCQFESFFQNQGATAAVRLPRSPRAAATMHGGMYVHVLRLAGLVSVVGFLCQGIVIREAVNPSRPAVRGAGRNATRRRRRARWRRMPIPRKRGR